MHQGKMAASTYDDFLRAVRTYQERYRLPALVPFEIAAPYDLFPERGLGSLTCERKWPDSWFHPMRAGVYAFFGDDAELLYVGKASFRSSISARLATYCGYQESRGSPCNFLRQWKGSPRYVTVVAVPEETRFEASALEEFLISRLRPPENYIGLDRA
jgi:hypothetical protein